MTDKLERGGEAHTEALVEMMRVLGGVRGTEVTVPANGWVPRPHQMKLWRYLYEGGKRAVAVWHRRAGKDEICLHHLCVAAMRRVGNYAYALPEYAHGRKTIWTAVNPHTGRRRIDEAFPVPLRAQVNDQEMFIRLLQRQHHSDHRLGSL